MKRSFLTLLVLLSGISLSAQPKNIPQAGKPVEKFDIGNNRMYRKGWIDFNKNGHKDVYEDPSAPIDKRVEDLLSQMTLEEKTCQMVTLYGYRRVLGDDLPTPQWKGKLWKDGIGAIDEHLNGFLHWGLPVVDNPNIWPASRHAWALNEVQRFFVEETRLGIPVDFTNEGIRGVEAFRATNFPTQLGIGHTWNRELVKKIGYITGSEARLLGYTNVYAPVLDVGRDQRWGRYEEVYSESPYLVAELGVAMVNGLQQDYQVAATAKHFIAYSNNKGAREGMARVDPQMSPRELENIHAYPWKEVMSRTGLLGVMSSYNDYDGDPVQGSQYWLTERLRNDFGFKGYVVSDSDAVEYLHSKHHTSANMKESVYQAVMAGLNVRCTFRTPDSYVLPLRELVREGRIQMEVVDARVRDVLKVKFLLGMFDRPYQMDLKSADEMVDGVENNKIALQASRESIVLLKNADNMLPLDASALRKVAVVGPNADCTTFANTHYGPLATHSVSVLEGLKTALAGKAEVVYSKGCELVDKRWPDSELYYTPPTEDEMQMIEEAVNVSAGSDVIIAVMGGGQRTCGENKSRSSLDLPGYQDLLLRKLKELNKPIVVVLINGRPVSINWAQDNVDAIIEAWYPGSHGGTAVAEVLLGDYNPGGKLTVTFPRSVGQLPFNFPCKPNSQVDGYTKTGPDGRQSRVHGALYEFGYGLSYTTFEYSDLKLSKDVLAQEDSVEISFNITNTGKRKGDEVVQLYFSDRLSSLTVYERQLRGFERVTLEPGETKTVTMTLHTSDLVLLDKTMKYIVEPGQFDIYVSASSSDDRLHAVISVTDENGEEVLPESYPDDVSVNRTSRFPAKIGVSENITVPLLAGKSVDKLTVSWDKGTDCVFEILTTSGGGQFLPVYRGEVSTAGTQQYSFEKLNAREIRVAVVKGVAVIKSIENKEVLAQ